MGNNFHSFVKGFFERGEKYFSAKWVVKKVKEHCLSNQRSNTFQQCRIFFYSPYKAFGFCNDENIC